MFSKKQKRKKKKKTAQIAYLMPSYWLEISWHPEGPATGQLDQGFPWFSLASEQLLRWYPNSMLHCMLHKQPPYGSINNFASMYPT
jgi:hypothetical protein